MRLLAIIFVLTLSSQVDAQLFRRWSSSNQHAAQGNHWGYPGSIADHLASTHGQSVTGLSHEQMLDLHDAIHDGRQVPKQVAVVAHKITVTVPMPKQLAKAKPIKEVSFWK